MVEKLFKFQFSMKKGNKVAGSFTYLLARVLLKLVFVMEPLIPVFAAYFLNKQLKNLEAKGLIISHTVRIERMARFCYKMNVRFVFGGRQLENILNELMKMV